MKKATRLIALLACMVLLVSAAAGCAPPAASQSTAGAGGDAPAASAADGGSEPATATGEKILRISQTVDPETLDPQMANSAATQVICAHIFEPLMRSHKGEVEPGAAESYEMSDDGLVYTFTLRDGMVWSDGEPLTAAHYEFGMQRLMDPATASPFSFIGMVLKNGGAVNEGSVPVEELGVKALDDKTVEITLEYPASYFLGMLQGASFAPARPDLVEKYGTDYATSAEFNAYCGPFVMTDWRKNDRVVMARNEDYWNKESVKLDGAEVLYVQDGNTAAAMAESGELHFADIPVTMASEYPDADFYYSGANDYVLLNNREGNLTANKNLRLALNYGISRGDYIALATNNVYEANQRFVLPQVNAVNGEYGTEYPLEFFPLEGDEAKAKEYLDAAMTDLGVSDPSEIELELLCSDSDTDRTQAEVIQNQWQTKLGITVNIRQVAYAQRLEMQTSGEFQACMAGWMPDYSDPYSYLELWVSTGPYNQAGYNSAVYDEAIEKSIYELDPKTRMDYLFEAENIMLEDGMLVPLQLRRIPYIQSPNVTGLEHYFVGLLHDFTKADIVG